MYERRAVTGFAFFLAGVGTLVVLQAGSLYDHGVFLLLAYAVALAGLVTDPRVSGGRWWGAVALIGLLVASAPFVLLAGSGGNVAAVFFFPLPLGVGCLLYLAGVLTLARQTGVEHVQTASFLPVFAIPIDLVLVVFAPFLLGAFGLAWMAFGGALAVSNATLRARTESGGW